MLVCSDDSFYIGLTTDLSRRLLAHESGFDQQSYTTSRRPVKLVWAQEFPTHDEAFEFECQIKGWSRAKKKALIEDDWDKIHKIVCDERKRREKKKRKTSNKCGVILDRYPHNAQEVNLVRTLRLHSIPHASTTLSELLFCSRKFRQAIMDY